jgi:hypothetical protein
VLVQSPGATASQYAGSTCDDFLTQSEAQYVYELDQVLFGDALDPDVDGVACDEEFAADGEDSRQYDQNGTLLEAGGPDPARALLPRMQDGTCPTEYPLASGDGCRASSPPE